jgi:anti-sigma factor RsiW
MRGEREAGGLWCREVLAVLSDYLDGELGPAARARVEAHLAECDVCERFGGRFAESLRRLRQELTDPPAVEPEVARRLRRRLDEESPGGED